jgi:hypothetical protein
MSASQAPLSGTVVRRIRFAFHSVSSGRVSRTFKHPRPCMAVEETSALADVPKKPDSPDELFIVFVPARDAAAAEKFFRDSFTATEPDAPALDVKWRGDRVMWRAGLAVVYLGGPIRDELQTALVEFAFYEGELRRLEAEMDAREMPATDDVTRAHTIERRDKAHWPRFKDTIEALTRMRLMFAGLAPRFTEEANEPGPVARRFATHLLRHARAEARADALDARLEACEELYEGANDRVADHKGWHHGHVLEVIIIALLMMEVVLLCVDLAIRGGE